MWLLDSNAGVVTPFHPVTEAFGAPIRVGIGPTDVATGLGSVWVTNQGEGTLSRIDPDHRRSRDHPDRRSRGGHRDRRTDRDGLGRLRPSEQRVTRASCSPSSAAISTTPSTSSSVVRSSRDTGAARPIVIDQRGRPPDAPVGLDRLGQPLVVDAALDYARGSVLERDDRQFRRSERQLSPGRVGPPSRKGDTEGLRLRRSPCLRCPPS